MQAVTEMENDLSITSLGGSVFKKRIANQGAGKRGGFRVLLAYQSKDKTFFIYGFAKNTRDNIKEKELSALKLLADELLHYSDLAIEKLVSDGALNEVKKNDRQAT